MKNLLPNPWLLATGISILSYMLILGTKLLFTTKFSRFLGARLHRWDDFVVGAMTRTGQLFMVTLSLYIGFRFIKHSPRFDLSADRFFFIILMWQITIWSHYLILTWISHTVGKKSKRNPAVAGSISLIQLFARAILFSIIFLFTLSNLGIRITTIIAGLGVGGIAVALALQKILGDLFASLSIVLDKPFVVGDFIVIDTYLGEVEKIGLKTTRIRSLGGEQIIFSNSDLLAARIRNYKRMHERRVVQNFHLPLHTPVDKLKSAVSIVNSVIAVRKMVRLERCHFMKIGSSAEIEAVYWVLSDDYNIHMDIQQEILYDVKNIFDSESIEFTYPTQTLQIRPSEITLKGIDSMLPSKDRSVDSIRS